MLEPTPCDVVAFMAHPDDLELTCGGTLALCVRKGGRAGAVDFTRGELGTLGTPEIRSEETQRASRVLGLSSRVNLGLRDGHLRDTDEVRREVVRLLRLFRPKVVIAPPREDHHPDHMAVAEILARSFYLAGVPRYAPGEPPWRPHALLHVAGSFASIPSIVVDVTEVYEVRRQAILCYRSQLVPEGPAESSTRVSHPDFLNAIDGTSRRYGALIGVAFGEAFRTQGPVPTSDIVSLYSKTPWEPSQKGV